MNSVVGGRLGVCVRVQVCYHSQYPHSQTKLLLPYLTSACAHTRTQTNKHTHMHVCVVGG